MVCWLILAVIVIFLAVILVRTAMFKPKEEEKREIEEVEFDRAAAVDALARLVQCKTVSNAEAEKEDNAEFEKLIGLLPVLYPNVTKTCPMQRMPHRGLLFHWKGREEGRPSILMAHYDVVAIEEDKWTHPAFAAEIIDGVMWGRGTLDTKNTFNAALSAAENLIKQGFQPKNDIYFAFSGNEEINGPGARTMVEWFRERKIEPEMVIDEGGAVVEGIFPGVSQPCGLIGIAEKGTVNITYTVNSDGGHASAPAPHTPVGIAALACTKVEAHPFKSHFTKPVLEMFDTLGRHSSFVYRMVFANLWCFKGILDRICKKGGGELNALVRTTVAFTQMNGSKQPNVIPPTVSMVSNIRLNPEDSVASAVEYIRGVINDSSVELSISDDLEPSPISRTDCEGWKRISTAVADTWKGCLVAPYLMVQCSDSRHYNAISDRVYRFSAADMTEEEMHSIHGNDEHIRLETIERAVEFYIRVIKQC